MQGHLDLHLDCDLQFDLDLQCDLRGRLRLRWQAGWAGWVCFGLGWVCLGPRWVCFFLGLGWLAFVWVVFFSFLSVSFFWGGVASLPSGFGLLWFGLGWLGLGLGWVGLGWVWVWLGLARVGWPGWLIWGIRKAKTGPHPGQKSEKQNFKIFCKHKANTIVSLEVVSTVAHTGLQNPAFLGCLAAPRGCPGGAPQGPRHSKRAKAKKQNISKTLWWSVEVIEVIRAALMTSRASERAWLTTLCGKGPEKAQKTKSRFFVLQALTPARRFCRKRAFAQSWASGPFPAQG